MRDAVHRPRVGGRVDPSQGERVGRRGVPAGLGDAPSRSSRVRAGVGRGVL